jgi:beta-glucosidase
VPQLYLTEAAGERRLRLLGFERVQLEPGSRRVSLTADPRLLGRFDGDAARWRIDEGTYRVGVGTAADAVALTGDVTLNAALFGS